MKSICSVFTLIVFAFSAHAQMECLRGNCRDGHSLAVYSNGNRYEGDFLAGMPHGLGVMDFTNGDRYIGDFHRKTREGSLYS